MNQLAPRLPGLYFSVEAPEPEATLPRMDIAAFVGLASSGPLHTPVAVEDSARFRDLFGPDLPLAWKDGDGMLQTSYLGRTVESFFRNGGLRCWVVRVADQTEAETNIFPIPGLLEANSWRPATAWARSEGSWSDELQVGTVRTGEALNLVDFTAVLVNGTGRYQADVIGGPRSLQVGDLLQFTFPESDLVLFVPVKSVDIVQARQQLVGDKGFWFLRYCTIDPPDFAIDAFQLVPEGTPIKLPLRGVCLPADESEFYTVDLALTLAEAPMPGDLLRIDFESSRTLLLPVRDVEALPPVDSPVEDGIRVSATEGYWPLSEQEGIRHYQWVSPDAFPLAERIKFAFWVWQGQELFARMPELSFCSSHPRFWAKLPTDASFFRLREGRRRSAPLPIEIEAAETPRFPLAGPDSTVNVTLPIGMPYAPQLALCQRPLTTTQPETRLQRNGLSTFSAALFLDDKLKRLSAKTLLTEANHTLFVRREPLCGLHALIPIKEVGLVSIPDAIHLGWEPSTPAVIELLPAPDLVAVIPGEQYEVQWRVVESATGYLLQESTEPTFAEALTRYQGPNNQIKFDPDPACSQWRYYRVRAMRNGLISAWSNTKFIKMPESQFDTCREVPLNAPVLQLQIPDTSDEKTLILSWNAVAEDSEYEIQEASEPAMVSAVTIAVEPTTNLVRPRRRDRVSYFRVRVRQGDEVGSWSNTVLDFSTPPTRPVLKSTAVYKNTDLLDMQRALLRLCRARGDIFALLSLPAHYRQEQALAHRTALAWLLGENGHSFEDRVPPLNAAEAHVLSYGALYHPWLYARTQGQSGTTPTTMLMPPDGAICGTFAHRAITRGAWIAPANEGLVDVVALAPLIDLTGWQALLQAQINVVRQDPRGFFVMSADTLSQSSDFRGINVRRLLILLRRLALREGMRYAFQSHNDELRRLIQHQFGRILADMYIRGAFAGSRPEAAYQVITDDRVNTRRQTEQGQLIVELQVAPSRPMAFITVRLLQTATESLAIEES